MTTNLNVAKHWTMRRKNSAKAEILIYEDIGDGMFGGLSAKSFVQQLTQLGDVSQIDVRINSWGGIGSEGIAMANALGGTRPPSTSTSTRWPPRPPRSWRWLPRPASS